MYHQEKADALSAAARDLFMQHGYANVSVAQLCRAVCITKPTFYRFFLSKEDLLESLYAVSPEDNPADTEETAGNYWQEIMRDLYRNAENDAQFGLDLCSQRFATHIRTGETYFEATKETLDRLADLIGKAQDEGQILSPLAPEHLARLLHTVYSGRRVCSCLTGKDPASYVKLENEMASIALVPDEFRLGGILI